MLFRSPSSSLLSPGSSLLASHLFMQASIPISFISPCHSFHFISHISLLASHFSRYSPLFFSSHLISSASFLLFSSPLRPSVSFWERHTPRLRRVLSAPCGASNSGTDFFLAGFRPSTPSLPDALKVIATAYSFPRYGRGIVAAA